MDLWPCMPASYNYIFLCRRTGVLLFARFTLTDWRTTYTSTITAVGPYCKRGSDKTRVKCKTIAGSLRKCSCSFVTPFLWWFFLFLFSPLIFCLRLLTGPCGWWTGLHLSSWLVLACAYLTIASSSRRHTRVTLGLAAPYSTYSAPECRK